MPATSSKVTLPSFWVSSRARDLPKPIAPEPEFFCIWRSTKKAMPRNSRNGSDWTSRYCQIDGVSSARALIVTFFSRSFWTSCGSPGLLVRNLVSLLKVPVSGPGPTDRLTSLTSPAATLSRNCE
jgi:hypothetical protein